MRRVIWSNSARDDYFAVLRHVAQDDADAAERIVSAIEQVGNGLADFATGHPGRVAGTYEKTVARLPYIIAYRLSDDDAVVTILHVIHTGRDWQPGEWPA